MTSPLISIIIPALNEADTIGAQLDALATQVSDGDCEVFVADNGSTDETVSVVTQRVPLMTVRVIDASARRGAAAARNLAVAEARGDLLVFVDADDVVLPGFVDAWRGIDPTVELASGPVVFFAADAPPPLDPTVAERRLPVQMGFLPYALGANFAVRRELFVRSGGFDESYPQAEDVELSWRLQLAGAGLIFVPDAVVAKREAPSWRATARQYFRYGYRDPYLYRDYRGRGAPPPPAWPTVKSYLGLVARVPLLWRAEPRKRWIKQFARRAGRLVGSFGAGAFYP